MNGEAKYYLSKHLAVLVDGIARDLKFKSHEFKITSKFDKGDNYLGEIQRAVVKGVKHNDKEEVLKLIIKTPPSDTAVRKGLDINAFYRREIYSYKVIMKAFDELQDKYNIPDKEKFKHAKWYAAAKEEAMEVIIFEDLNAMSYRMYDRLKSVDCDHLILIVKTLARYHALSFAAKAKLPKELYDEFKKHTSKQTDMNIIKSYFCDMSSSVKNILDDDSDRGKFSDFCDCDLTEKYYKYLNIHEGAEDNPYFIITHGDSWINNMLFKYEDGKPAEMIQIDWQIIKYSSPITDLVYLLFTCTDEAIRYKMWDEILDTYYNTLRSRLIQLDCDPDECYPGHVFKQDLRDYLGFGLLMAIIIVPLVLNNREDSVDLSDIMDDDKYQPGTVKLSEKCISRLQGVVRHFAKLNVI